MSGDFIKSDKLKQIVANINSLVSQRVLVGIPEDTSSRNDEESGPMTNAALGFIHEYGSPANNIPARPFLMPGVRDGQEKFEPRLKKAAAAALNGNAEKMDAEMTAAGMIASTGVQRKINSGDFIPLADATLEARAARGRKGAKLELESRREGNAPGTAFAKPLIDTGQLRNAITFVVRKAK